MTFAFVPNWISLPSVNLVQPAQHRISVDGALRVLTVVTKSECPLGS